MVLDRSAGQRMLDLGLVQVVLIVAAVIALMLLATAILGVQTAMPSYELAPDPAGMALPF